MPTYTLSNWEKTLIFQGMSHIGTPEFYKQVQDDIRSAKQDEYVLFYEWVRPGSKENEEKLNQAMWVKFDKDLYANFSKLYGVVNQDNDMFLNQVNNLDFNVDLSIDEVIEKYEEKDFEPKQNREVLDAGTEITKVLAELNERQLKILVYINQAILNTIIQSEGIREGILSLSGNSDIFSVILEDRNVFLVDKIQKSQYDKIYITYGLMHFSWVLELLKQQDSNWQITNTSYMTPISN